MARTYRNEAAANVAMADRVQALAQNRADWRAVLTARDMKRDARRANLQRAARRQFGMLQMFGFVLALAPIVSTLCA